MTKIKICGLKREEDIDMVNRLRPDYCGFIINFPKSHRNQTPQQVRSLVKGLDRSSCLPVGVFVNAPVELVAELLNEGSIDLAQLHGEEDEAYIRSLKERTAKPVIKAFSVKSPQVLAEAEKSSADYLLLDQGKGGGRTFDWSIMEQEQEAMEAIRRRGKWFLAGGIREDNMEEAIRRFRPYGVDLSTAVETDGRKDEEKVRRIIAAVRRIKI